MAGTTPSPDSGPPRLWLARHGETDWSADGKHTGTTDVPLNDTGRRQAAALGRGLQRTGPAFAAAWTSPLRRARETAALAGFPQAKVLDGLREWDYGEYEGTRTADVRRERNEPDWLIWTADIGEGETARDVGERADEAIARILASTPQGDVIVFSHGHFLRMLAARWIGRPPAAGRRLALDTGTVSVLGHEHEYRVINRWNAPLDDPEASDED